MPVFQSIASLVGNTPLLKVRVNGDCQVFLKLEKSNPAFSLKDRAAVNMLHEAERRGLLGPGATVIESSSGNTGISLAMLCAERGYRFICVIDNHTQEEKVRIMQAFGTVIERVAMHLPPDYHAAKERMERVEELLRAIPGAFYVNQGDNLDNRDAHYRGTAEEILSDLGPIDYFFAAVGTGGSISGAGRRLKEVNPTTIVVAIEPHGSILFGHPYHPFFQSGAGSSKVIFRNLDHKVVDENYRVTDQEAFTTCRFLARKLGLLVGGSGGAVFYKTLQYVVTRSCRGKVVVLVPDGGERYLSTIFNDEWMEQHRLLDPSIWDFLDSHMCHKPNISC